MHESFKYVLNSKDELIKMIIFEEEEENEKGMSSLEAFRVREGFKSLGESKE